MSGLVLSLFPGIGLLDMAFEDEGFCVVRGPDLLWGGDIRKFHPPAGRFDGIIGGPPCQAFSELAFLVRANGHEPKFGNLIPEFERCVAEAAPNWFLMENVTGAPEPNVKNYAVNSVCLNNRWFGAEQNRDRRFSYGCHWAQSEHAFARSIDFETFETQQWSPAVTGDMRVATNGERVRTKPGGGVCPHVGKLAPFDSMLRLQGLPDDFLSWAPFTTKAKRQAVGNGVPLPMGRAVAKAVKSAIQLHRSSA
jgi:DNA (cytosine-5)-methyltransferase 1